jgi:two-component system, NarL family, nitrate/nitrite response regulator NarL
MNISPDHSQKTVVVCDTQPIMLEGLRTLLATARDLRLLAALNSLEIAKALVSAQLPDVVIVDKGFGMRTVLNWIRDLKMAEAPPAVTVWGASMTKAETLQLLGVGATGIVRKTADVDSIMSCLRSVASGRHCVIRDEARQQRHVCAKLTARQHQVLQMVEQGFKNREIALKLGIQVATVIIHRRHILEKTGLRDRGGLSTGHALASAVS